MHLGSKSPLMVHRDKVRKNVHGLLLVVLILLIVCSSTLVGHKIGLLIIDALLFMISLLIARAFLYGQRKVFWSYITMAGLISVLDAVTPYCFTGNHLFVVTAVTVIGYAVLVLTALLIMVSRIVKERSVTSDIIFGGICIYMLLGFFWFLLFQFVAVLDPGAFYTTSKLGSFRLLYFSFNTLTTLGYGDIVPINRFAQALCNLEAISGQMFPAIFISRLVSLYVVNESKSAQDTGLSQDS